MGHRRADGQASLHARVVGHVKVAISWAHCHARRPCTDRDAVDDLTGHRAYHRDAVAVHDVDLGTIWAHRHVCGRLADLDGCDYSLLSAINDNKLAAAEAAHARVQQPVGASPYRVDDRGVACGDRY